MDTQGKGNTRLRLNRAIKYLREEVCRDLPLQQLHILLEIANQDGIDSATLLHRCDMQSGSLSRNITTVQKSG